MEQLPKDLSVPHEIDSKKMLEFRCASDKNKFVDENPYIINAWVKPYSSYEDSYSLLHCMVESDDLSAVRALLQAGVDSNIVTDSEKYTPLHMAYSKEMAELLLQHHAQLESKNKDGKTPLYCALFNRNKPYSGYFHKPTYNYQIYQEKYDELMQYLLEEGADSNAVDGNGESLLHRAIGGTGSFVESYPQYITLLMQFSANVEVKDCDGKAPYDLAIERLARCKNILEVLKEYNIFFVSNELIGKINWYDDNRQYQLCEARNLFKLLQNGAQELKRCMACDPKRYWEDDIKKMLADLLKMAQKSDVLMQNKGKITYYENKGYLFNRVNMVDLENWVGKDSI
ncbi:MAG TPA: ankyrin repeat domain-containing protein, partial [Aquella sp.]|nr:ankyrin repeat domain-containing protein [Aquella sp.]